MYHQKLQICGMSVTLACPLHQARRLQLTKALAQALLAGPAAAAGVMRATTALRGMTSSSDSDISSTGPLVGTMCAVARHQSTTRIAAGVAARLAAPARTA